MDDLDDEIRYLRLIAAALDNDSVLLPPEDEAQMRDVQEIVERMRCSGPEEREEILAVVRRVASAKMAAAAGRGS